MLYLYNNNNNVDNHDCYYYILLKKESNIQTNNFFYHIIIIIEKDENISNLSLSLSLFPIFSNTLTFFLFCLFVCYYILLAYSLVYNIYTGCLMIIIIN